MPYGCLQQFWVIGPDQIEPFRIFRSNFWVAVLEMRPNTALQQRLGVAIGLWICEQPEMEKRHGSLSESDELHGCYRGLSRLVLGWHLSDEE